MLNGAIDIEQRHLAIVQDILQSLVPGTTVLAFGSRVRGRARRYSDLDLAVVSSEPLPLRTLSEIKDAFSDSDLPYRVDIVDWQSTDPGFQRIISEASVVIQA